MRLVRLVFLFIAMLIAVVASRPIEALAAGWGGHGWGGHGWGRHGFAPVWAGRFGSRFARFGMIRPRFFAGSLYGYSYYGNSGYDPGCVWIRQLLPTPYGPQWQYTPACADGY